MPSADTISRAPVESVAISQIEVGVRRREKLNGIASLTRSIEEHGLIHPILIDQDGTLVTGARRLAAVKALGRTRIHARRVKVTEELLRNLELDENKQRHSLSAHEASRARLTAIARAKAEILNESGDSVPGSALDTAAEERAGVDKRSHRRARQIVDIVDRFPFMQKWSRRQLLAGEELGRSFKAADNEPLTVLLDQPGVPPKSALEILENLRDMPAEDRRKVYKLAQSKHEHERTRALTDAAKLPPMPDERLVLLKDARAELVRATKARPKDRKIVPLLRSAVASIDEALKLIRENQE